MIGLGWATGRTGCLNARLSFPLSNWAFGESKEKKKWCLSLPCQGSSVLTNPKHHVTNTSLFTVSIHNGNKRYYCNRWQYGASRWWKTLQLMWCYYFRLDVVTFRPLARFKKKRKTNERKRKKKHNQKVTLNKDSSSQVCHIFYSLFFYNTLLVLYVNLSLAVTEVSFLRPCTHKTCWPATWAVMFFFSSIPWDRRLCRATFFS